LQFSDKAANFRQWTLCCVCEWRRIYTEWFNGSSNQQ